MSEKTPEALKKARNFWNGSADWNVHRAIYDSAEIRDEQTKEEAFDRLGELDAQKLAVFVHPEARVVDLGCGIGRVMRFLAPRCAEVIGVDISEKMIELGRGYLRGVKNARLVQTGGAELPGIADASVDFLYSVICLIHVDKRSAFRYLREMRRTLKPEGVAYLQFLNIESPAGLAEFQRVVDLDIEYPLEFYSRGEIAQLASAAGLKAVGFQEDNQFLTVNLVPDSPEAISRLVKGLHLSLDGASGLFAGGGKEGQVKATMTSELNHPQPLWMEGALKARRGSGFLYTIEGHIVLMPHQKHTVELVHASDGSAVVHVDGRPAADVRVHHHDGSVTGEVEFVAALCPPAYRWSPERGVLFPNLAPEIPITGRMA